MTSMNTLVCQEPKNYTGKNARFPFPAMMKCSLK